jgi:hypothetical protein
MSILKETRVRSACCFVPANLEYDDLTSLYCGRQRAPYYRSGGSKSGADHASMVPVPNSKERLLAAQAAPTTVLVAPASDRFAESSVARRIAGELAWLAQAASGSDRSGQQRKKDVAILALDTVFANYNG